MRSDHGRVGSVLGGRGVWRAQARGREAPSVPRRANGKRRTFECAAPRRDSPRAAAGPGQHASRAGRRST
ncbi:hypothetical protein GLE_3442 [Lysobacter enzymogenes]|uniref:Uncharacterized protein n=1 Tax=Lysobacter enzymogenes TaxID=69 RepID=A0A0S2DJT4_LYSEN|nr:hypothetical protein GLE_3442 [Lysobacter enzymogenes]